MTLRIGIVGAGENTRLRHIPGFQAIDGVEVVAVCNRSRASGERVAKDFEIGRVHDDWRQLVQDDDVDAVCIGTWPYLHAPVTLAGLEAGKHVLTEARMAVDVDEARAMLHASEASDRVAMVVPAPFWLDSESYLIDLVRDGLLGDVLEVHARGLGGAWSPDAPIHWRQRRDLSGENILMLGILNETVRRYVGDDVAVVAHGKVFVDERVDAEAGAARTVDVPDSLAVISELACGGTAVYHLSGVARFGGGPTLEVHGTRGAFRLCDGGAFIAQESDDAFRPLEVPAGRRGGWRVEADFVDAIRDGKPVTRTSFADGVRYMEFTAAVNRSFRTEGFVVLAHAGVLDPGDATS